MAKRNETKNNDDAINNEINIKEEKVIEEVIEDREDVEVVEKEFKEDVEENIRVEHEKDEEVEKTKKPYKTEHKFAMGDKVWVCDFSNKRGNGKFSQVVNEYQFNPKEGEIERVIITDRIQYKLKNKSGSLYDEEDVCYTEKQAMDLCDKKNRRE